MLDLETWGTAPGSALRSIAAIQFNPYGRDVGLPVTNCEFYANIDKASCEAVGLKIDPATIEWWSQQSREAQDILSIEPKPLHHVVQAFDRWWRDVGGTYLWSNGANFDEVLWRMACEAVGCAAPWKYWNVRDTRTCWHLARLNPKTISRDGIAHDALADARHQALCVTKAYTI